MNTENTWWKIFHAAIKRNGWRQLFFYLSNLDFTRFIEYTKTFEFLNCKSDICKSDIILELGCGYSILPTILSNSCKYYICLDLSKNACKYQATLPNVSSVVADMQHLPFKTGVIPTIVAISSIEHIPNDRLVFEEISRISKNGANTVISIPYSNRHVEIKKIERSKFLLNILYKFKGLWKKILDRHLYYFLEQTSTDSFMKYYTLEEINSLIRSGDFSIENYYLYENILLQKFFKVIPQGWFLLKDIIVGWILWNIEDMVDLKNPRGIILRFKRNDKKNII